MEAYYDKDKGRWVFPGQEDDPTADLAAGPPPTMVSVVATKRMVVDTI